MKNVYHNKIWRTGAVKIHLETTPIALIKGKDDTKAEKDRVKTELSRYPTSEKLYMYEFKIDFFDNGKPEDFLLLLVHNYNMSLNAPGTVSENPKLQYLCNLLHGEALCQFDTFCDQVESMTMAHLNRVILGLGNYSPPVNLLSKQKRVMHCRTRNLRKLKVRHYTDHIIDNNSYLADLPIAKRSDKLVKRNWMI